MATVTVQLHDPAFVHQTPTAAGTSPVATSVEVEISEEPRAARPRHSYVAPREGGYRSEWDGLQADRVWLVVDAPTESGMRAHPIGGIDTMSAGALQSAREYLGLTGDQMAAMLTNAHGRPLGPRILRAFEQGTETISPNIRDQVENLLRESEMDIDAEVDRLISERASTITVWRTDNGFHTARPDLTHWPARWWRHAAAKIVSDHGRRFTIVSE